MTLIVRPTRRAGTLIALAAGLIAVIALAVAVTAGADSTPVGHLPAGAVSTITTAPSQLVAVALPHAAKKSGLSWRLARRYDSNVVRQISEADVDASVVLVFKVVGRGETSLVFGLTRGDTSPKAPPRAKSSPADVASRGDPPGESGPVARQHESRRPPVFRHGDQRSTDSGAHKHTA